jgi:hypothetical protein
MAEGEVNPERGIETMDADESGSFFGEARFRRTLISLLRLLTTKRSEGFRLIPISDRLEMNPNGIPQQSPGLRGTSYPGRSLDKTTTPTGLRPLSAPKSSPKAGATPLGLTSLGWDPQGSSCLATLGWGTQSLWDCPQSPSTKVNQIGLKAARLRPRLRLSCSASRTKF